MKQNKGKIFEADFKKSAKQKMFVYRLRDSPASFNQNEHIKYIPRNISDFIMYKWPNMYLVECKSHKGVSIPFSDLKTKKSDNRIKDMAEASNYKGVKSAFF